MIYVLTKAVVIYISSFFCKWCDYISSISVLTKKMDDAKPGHDVNFHGLKGAAHLNGTTGTLVKYLKEEERWSVRRSNGQLVNAKPGNLERVRANDNETKLISTMLEEARKRKAQKTNKHQG